MSALSDFMDTSDAGKLDMFEEAHERMVTAENALRAIKTGVINIPPDKSFGDWSTTKITTLKDAQEYAASVLDGQS